MTHLRAADTGRIGEMVQPVCHVRVPGRLIPKRDIVEREPTCPDCRELSSRKEAGSGVHTG